MIHADALADDADGVGAVVDLLDRRALVFERLIHLEKVHHLLENVLGQFADVPIAVIRRVAEGDGDDLLVQAAAVRHFDDSDGIAPHQGHGIDGRVAEDEHVQRVAVVRQRAGQKAVVGGIDRGSIEHAVEPQQPRFLVQLIFFLAALRDLDERLEVLFRDPRLRDVVPDIHADLRRPPFF